MDSATSYEKYPTVLLSWSFEIPPSTAFRRTINFRLHPPPYRDGPQQLERPVDKFHPKEERNDKKLYPDIRRKHNRTAIEITCNKLNKPRTSGIIWKNTGGVDEVGLICKLQDVS